MSELPDRHEGPQGWAERQAIPSDHPQSATTVDAWLMHLPGQGVGWDRFLMSAVTLADVPGTPPAKRSYPAAEYELNVCALNPEKNPRPGVPGSWEHMLPVNLAEQFHGITPDQVRDLLSLAARECVEGRLLAETQMYVELFDGSPPKMMTIVQVVDAWKAAISSTVEHFRTGGLHASAN